VSLRYSKGLFVWLAAAGLLAARAGLAQAQVVASTRPATVPAATQPAQPGNDQLEPAADAAWAVLQALQDYVHASQILDDPQKRAEGLAKARRELLSLVTIRPESDEQLPTYVAMWPAVVARYVDGFQRDRMTLMQADQQVLVMAVAANPQDKETYDQLYRELTASLQAQGYSGESLASLRSVRLKRELAQRGIGYPVTATILITLRKVDGQWKASGLDLRPPHLPVPGSQPARNPSIITLPGARTTSRPATQSAR
jgi:hypothetical protein